MNKRMIRPGELYWVYFGGDSGSCKINGERPAVVVKADPRSSLAHVVPLTTSKKRRLGSLHIRIEGHGLTRPSIALIEQVCLIDKSSLGQRIGTIAGTGEMDRIRRQLASYFHNTAA